MREEWESLFTKAGAPAHHTFLVAGEPEELLSDLRKYLLAERGVPSGEINFLLRPQLTVGESRELKQALGAPFLGEHRFHLIGFNNITSEAEQALLKLLEEPPAGTVFILVCPRPLSLSATVRSRAWLLTSLTTASSALNFTTLPISKRLALITKELKAREETPSEGHKYAEQVLAAVEGELAAAVKAGKIEALTPSLIEALAAARGFLARGARFTPKLFLEYLALILPRL